MTRNVLITNGDASSKVVLVCEHASKDIPETLGDLGLSCAAKTSHAAWDPGAMDVATVLATQLDAVLVASCVSRLVYDCNRPPSAPGAMPAQSEIYTVPGNMNLTAEQKAQRVAAYYDPFRTALADTIAKIDDPVIVTVHSFTPTYHGQPRAVEIGILHDIDTRLADAMMNTATRHTSLCVERNAPYGPGDGVTHTLCEHAISHGHLNVMLEIRNDLIETTAQQTEIAGMIAGWLTDALGVLGDDGART